MRAAPLLAGLLVLLGAPGSLSLAPAGLDATEARAAAILDGAPIAGASPAGWIAWAEARLALPPAAAPEAGLAGAVEALYAAAGVAPTATDRAELAARTAALEPAVAAALAPLVAALAEAYDAQEAVAAQVDVAASERGEPMLPLAATEAGAANAERVLGAVGAFRARAAALPPTAGFADPLGLVVLGGQGDDTHVRGGVFGDRVLLADLGGHDLDLTSAGAACPSPSDEVATCNGLALSVRVDLAGNDTYRAAGPHLVAQGAGVLGGLGVLVDAAGDDRYEARTLVSHGPFLTYYINGVVQGAGEGGHGLLLDLAGDDAYVFTGASRTHELFGQGQGFAGLGGLGALLDGAGHDAYDARIDCDGAAGQFCGIYVQSTALYPGVSLLLDAGDGRDRYHGVVVAPQEDYYSQAFAAFGALAIQVDGGGDDDYLASATSTAPGLATSLNCAFGTAEYAGAVAVFLDRGGDDRYLTETISPNPPMTMAEGFSLASFSLYWDVAGDDWHEMRSVGPGGMVTGRGVGSSTLENSAVYLDTGGNDVYADGLGANGAVWGTQPGNVGIGVDAGLL